MCFKSVSISLGVSTNVEAFRQFDCQIGQTPKGAAANPLRARAAPADSCLMDAEKPKARQKLPRRRRRTQLKRLDGVDGGSRIGLEEAREGVGWVAVFISNLSVWQQSNNIIISGGIKGSNSFALPQRLLPAPAACSAPFPFSSLAAGYVACV